VKIAVVGAGAIGGYVGAALARAGADVTLIARGAHLRAIQRDGLRVLSPDGDFTVHAQATESLEPVRDADVVILGVKAYQLPEIVDPLRTLLRAETAVVAAQNGIPWWYLQAHPGPLNGVALTSVDPDGVVASAIPLSTVVGCVVYCATAIESPGVIRHVEGTRLTIGEPDGSSSDRCTAISKALAAGGLKCPVTRHLDEAIWLKLIGNAAFNPLTALTGTTLAELGEQPEVVDVARSIMEECEAVAHALGVTLRIPLERRLEAGIAVGAHKTSMLQDLEAGKPLEIDCITGAVIEIGARLGIPTPHTSTVHACAKLLDRRRRVLDTPRSSAEGEAAAMTAELRGAAA
jgi:2-dehydropantoate 2-reductase